MYTLNFSLARKWRVSSNSPVIPSGTPRPPVKSSGNLFIKGPIPFDWLARANTLPGKAGPVGLALWFLSGLRCSTTVQLTYQVGILAGCRRQAIYEALKQLEQDGLITVIRRPGARPIVTILAVSKGANVPVAAAEP